MRPEKYVFWFIFVFFAVVTPIYWFMAQEIAGTFVLASGAVYFAFMAAWLNVFTLVGTDVDIVAHHEAVVTTTTGPTFDPASVPFDIDIGPTIGAETATATAIPGPVVEKIPSLAAIRVLAPRMTVAAEATSAVPIRVVAVWTAVWTSPPSR